MAKTKRLTAKQFTDSIHEMDNFNEVGAARDAIFAVSVLIGQGKVSTAQNIYLLREVATEIEDVEVCNPPEGRKAAKAGR